MTGSEPPPVGLRSARFRATREAEWRRLDTLLEAVERGRTQRLTDADIIAIPVLYRAALSSLSVARATSLDAPLVAYLEALSLRGYLLVYGVRAQAGARMLRFFSHDWPDAVQALRGEIVLSAAIQLIGMLTAMVLVSADADWFADLVPADLAADRTPAASTEALRAGLYAGPREGGQMLSVFATFLFTHNAQVAILSFALGFALCLPTALLSLWNGCILGAFIALFAAHGLAWNFAGWLLIHGVTELLAFTIAAAAGFRLGRALAFPGRLTRIRALTEAGQVAVTAMAGVFVMLFCAGLLEGIGRQIIRDDALRYAVAAASALVWGVYLFRRPAR